MALAPFSDDHPLLATPCVWHPGAGRGGYSIVHFRTTFVLDAAIPDLIPFADEILLGLGTLLLANIRKRKQPDVKESDVIDAPRR